MAEGIHANITADVSDYDKNLAKAAATTEKFNASGKKAVETSSSLGKAIDKVDTAGLSKNINNANTAAKSVTSNFKLAKNSTQQLGYQFQDIAVQAQMGTSAFVILGQQGSQIAALFGPGGAMAGAVLAIGAAIGGTLFNSLSSAGKEAETAQERFIRLSDSLREVAQAGNELKMFELNDSISEQAEVIEKESDKLKELQDELRKLDSNKDATVGMYEKMKRAIEEQNVALIQETNIYNELKKSLLLLSKPQEDSVKSYRTGKSAIVSYIESLRSEADQLGMTATQKAMYSATTKGANQTQLNEVAVLRQKIDLYNQEQEAIKLAAKSKEELARLAEEEAQKEMQRLASRAALFAGAGEDMDLQEEQAKNELKLAVLREQLENEVITAQEFNALKEAEEQRHMDALREIRSAGMNTLEGLVTASYGKQAGLIAGSLSDILSSTSAYSKKAFEAHKVLSLGTAIISGYEAATSAWAQGMRVGGPPVAAAFTAASVAKTAAQIQAIRSQSYGSSSGGSSSTSDTTSGATTSAEAQENRIANVTLVGDTFSRSSVEGLMEQLKEASDMGYKVNFG